MRPRTDEESARAIGGHRGSMAYLVRDEPYPTIGECPKGCGREGGTELFNATVVLADI